MLTVGSYINSYNMLKSNGKLLKKKLTKSNNKMAEIANICYM